MIIVCANLRATRVDFAVVFALALPDRKCRMRHALGTEYSVRQTQPQCLFQLESAL
jgi:hypothetical protein